MLDVVKVAVRWRKGEARERLCAGDRSVEAGRREVAQTETVVAVKTCSHLDEVHYLKVVNLHEGDGLEASRAGSMGGSTLRIEGPEDEDAGRRLVVVVRLGRPTLGSV